MKAACQKCSAHSETGDRGGKDSEIEFSVKQGIELERKQCVDYEPSKIRQKLSSTNCYNAYKSLTEQ